MRGENLPSTGKHARAGEGLLYLYPAKPLSNLSHHEFDGGGLSLNPWKCCCLLALNGGERVQAVKCCEGR